MANKFVWSGAAGANDGSSWDNAYTSLMRDWGAEGTFTPASDYIYVRSVHAESTDAVLTITGSTAEGTVAPCRVICVVGDTTGTTPGALATGAAVNTITTTTNDLNIDEGLYVYGVDFFSVDDIVIGSTNTDVDLHLENCRLDLAGTNAGDQIVLGANSASFGTKIIFTDVTLDFGSTGQGISCRPGVALIWNAGAVDVGLTVLFEVPSVSSGANVAIRGVDFSAMTSTPLVNGSTNVLGSALFRFERCLLPTGGTFVKDTIDVPGFRVESYHCQIGTDADPSYQMEIQDSRGTISVDTARYRTGGASDGERTNPYSWELDTSVGSVRGYPGHALESPPIAGWIDGDGATAKTVTVYVASGGTLNDDELWMVVEGPNDAATNSLSVFNTTRVAPETAASALTTDAASTWTGADVGTKQKMAVTWTPDKPGPFTVRIYAAKATERISVDPFPVVT